jgi:hypothetical protein
VNVASEIGGKRKIFFYRLTPMSFSCYFLCFGLCLFLKSLKNLKTFYVLKAGLSSSSSKKRGETPILVHRSGIAWSAGSNRKGVFPPFYLKMKDDHPLKHSSF